MFGRLIKLIHFLAIIGFVGGLASSLVLADFAGNAPPGVLAALRQSIVMVAEALVVPSLIVLVVSGMLLVVARPHLIGARWVWAKALVTLVIASIALLVVQPAITRAAVLAAEGSLGSPSLAAMTQAFSAEQLGGATNLALALVAIGLAVWRPRLGQSKRETPGEEVP